MLPNLTAEIFASKPNKVRHRVESLLNQDSQVWEQRLSTEATDIHYGGSPATDI